MIIRNAKVFREDGTFVRRDVYIAGDRFVDSPEGEVIDGSGCYAIPGLVDVHFHGCVGYDFCDGTPEAISAMASYEAKSGVTAICPATMTYPEDKLATICETAKSYEAGAGEATLVGINMEGPFISMAKKGAQNGAFLHQPDTAMFRRLQAASGGLVKLLDIAPEEPGAFETISDLKDEVTISIAHTAADYETACEAFHRGARHVTHLYNAMPPFSHRAPGVIGAAFDAPHCHVELITDGVHIHPSVVRATFQLFGDDRVVLISDSMMATGLPDGEYSLGGQAVTVTGNRATLHDGTIAGSATNLLDCLRTAVHKMGVPLGSAVKAATVNPAKSIGIYGAYGSIDAGKFANLVLLGSDLHLEKVILRGEILN